MQNYFLITVTCVAELQRTLDEGEPKSDEQYIEINTPRYVVCCDYIANKIILLRGNVTVRALTNSLKRDILCGECQRNYLNNI